MTDEKQTKLGKGIMGFIKDACIFLFCFILSELCLKNTPLGMDYESSGVSILISVVLWILIDIAINVRRISRKEK